MEDKVSILIVDDDPDLRRMLSEVLKHAGYNPVAFSGGTAALVELEKVCPAVAVIDLKMEDMTGLELMEKIKRRLPYIECILLTAHASRETAIEAVNLGAYSYVEKPYEIDRLLLTIRNAVEKHAAAEELSRLKDFHENIVVNMLEGIVIEDMTGYVSYVNPGAGKLLGYSLLELEGKHWTEFCPVDQRAIIEAANERREQGGEPERYEVELLRKDGRRVPVLASGSALYKDGKQVGILSVFTDITERKRAEDKLRYMSIHDSLTGLYNRGYFEEEMSRLERGRQYPLGVVMVDIDDLKAINDSLGHEAGDELLRRSAAVLKKTFRADDVVARIGGDEFAVLLPRADAIVIEQALKRLRAEVEFHNEKSLNGELHLSLGAATVEFGDSLSDALKVADSEMYQEKLSKGEKPRSKPNTQLSQNP
jgi:diguanylate cyclase (GGDEF)-like protein/PAS domain S-box-containing protein